MGFFNTAKKKIIKGVEAYGRYKTKAAANKLESYKRESKFLSLQSKVEKQRADIAVQRARSQKAKGTGSAMFGNKDSWSNRFVEQYSKPGSSIFGGSGDYNNMVNKPKQKDRSRGKNPK
jgi:hypothetical protein